VTHRGVTLTTRWIDADTVEYTVRHPTRAALAVSSAYLWSLACALLLAMALAVGAAGGRGWLILLLVASSYDAV
jgi:hypothetical protein